MSKHSLFTSNSRKNFIFLIKLILAVSLLVGYIYHVLPQYDKGYNASLIDKVDRLVSIDEPKIVLLGHSNLTFGIDSKMIEDELGIPVVNMGLHGGNGNAFHEEMAKYNVVPGDIYVLCHSAFNDDNLIHETMTAWSSIENHFNLWKILRLSDTETMVRSFPIYLKKSLALYSSGSGNQDPGGVYARSAFNEYGDVAVLREGSQYTFESAVSQPEIGDITVNRINELNEYLKDRGAVLVVAGYPIGNGNLTVNAESFITFQNELSSRLDCPVISNYADYMFDYKYFYNTNLHLNTEGTALRTTQLIADLKRWKETGMDANPDDDDYEDIVSDDNLSHCSDIYEYLDCLLAAKDRYTIIISAKDDASCALNDTINNKLQMLGVTSNIGEGYRYSYVGILENGNILFEGYEHERIDVTGLFDEGRMQYAVSSGGYDRGNVSSIVLNGQEYSENCRGLNIVVYSNETHRILDEVCFDTCSEELTVTR